METLYNELPTDAYDELLKEITYAVVTLQFHNEVESSICRCFQISEEGFNAVKLEVAKEREHPKVFLDVSSVKVKNLRPSRGGGTLECCLRVGNDSSFHTRKINCHLIPEWNTRFHHLIENFGTEKLDIDIWHESERDPRDCSFFVRSLDTLSKKVKTTFRPQVTSLENAKPLKCRPTISDAQVQYYDKTAIGDNTIIESPKSRRSSFVVGENSWVASAFATLKRQKTEQFDNLRRNFLDLSSPIPTASSFQTEQAKGPELQDAFQEKADPPDDEDVKVKSEVNVQRQLFPRDDKGPTSPDNTGSAAELFGFTQIPLRDNSPAILRKTPITKSPPNRLRECQTARGVENLKEWSGSKDEQSWRRLSISSFDRAFASWTENKCVDRKSKRKEQTFSIYSPLKNLSAFSEKGIPLRFRANDRERICNATISIRKIFCKMACCKWTAEENIVPELSKSSRKQDLIPSKSESVSLSLELKVESQCSSVPAEKYISESLKLFLDDNPLAQTQDTRDHELGIFLPISSSSKIILQCLAFVHNVSEVKICLAIWSALVHQTEGSALTGQDRKLSGCQETNGNNNQNNKKNKKLQTSREIHPEFLLHWLTKVEAVVSCSYTCYTKSERAALAESIDGYVKLLCRKLKRLHSAYALHHSSHLTFALRSIHLLTESRSIQKLMEEAGIEVPSTWPKSAILKAAEEHAENWTQALETEVPCASKVQEHESRSSPLNVFSGVKTTLAEAIRNCERALLAVNDFVVLGEKVYEPVFKSELDESYMNLVWKILGPAVVKHLEPVLVSVQKIDLNNVSVLELRLLQDIHVSVWILVLQLSKLQRFEAGREPTNFLEYKLPQLFSETFVHLIRLWIDLSFFRAEETLRLELEADTLTVEGQTYDYKGTHLSSSASEFIEILTVFQEKIARLSLPDGKKDMDLITSHVHNKLSGLVTVYQCRICKLALENSVIQEIITPQMCLAISNVRCCVMEAEKLILRLATDDTRWSDYSLEYVTRDAAFTIFSKSLPRISTRIANVLTKCQKEYSDYISSWIRAILEEPLTNSRSASTTTLQYFWDFLFSIIEREEEALRKPKDFRNLGDFVDGLHTCFKSVLRIELFDHSERAFQQLSQKIQLKVRPTSEIIRMYYSQRYNEQTSLESDRSQPLVVNIHFWKGKGLVTDIHMGPLVNVSVTDKRRSSWVFTNFTDLPELQQNDTVANPRPCSSSVRSICENKRFFKDWESRRFIKSASSSGLLNILTKPSKSTEFYVKVKLEPSSWFKGSGERKSKKDVKNPPVFDSHLIFAKVGPDCESVRRGGFAVFRLKYSNSKHSQVVGEAIFPLKEAPHKTTDNRRRVQHSFLPMSRPTKLQDYSSLVELSTRKEDKVASAFLEKLENLYVY